MLPKYLLLRKKSLHSFGQLSRLNTPLCGGKLKQKLVPVSQNLKKVSQSSALCAQCPNRTHLFGGCWMARACLFPPSLTSPNPYSALPAAFCSADQLLWTSAPAWTEDQRSDPLKCIVEDPTILFFQKLKWDLECLTLCLENKKM